MSQEDVANKYSSEAEMRQQMIDNEFGRLIKEMMETEDLEEEDEIEPESLEALKIAANTICYLRKYYDVSNDKIIYFPSLVKAIIDYSLFEEAEKYYYEEDDEFPMDYSVALRSVAFEREEIDGDDDGNGMDDDLMARLSMSVQLTAMDQDELRASMEQAELEDAKAEEEGLEIVQENDGNSSWNEEEDNEIAVADDADMVYADQEFDDTKHEESEASSHIEETQDLGDDLTKDLEQSPATSIPETEPSPEHVPRSLPDEKVTHAENTEINNERLSIRESMVSITSEIRRQLHSHFMSTMALCSAILAMLYTLFSVFSYSGFMVMHLVPGVTQDNVGTYAGFLASSFMVGRALSSYPWGKLADIYGRKFVLVASLSVSAIMSIVFGCSTSLAMAMTSRFFMGLGNGIMVAAKTSISELAKGNKELESKGVGLLMSMVGYGMLLSPSIGGLMSDPKKQYPDFFAHHDKDSWTLGLVETYPYLAPNVVASLLSIISIIFIILSVEETLPEDMRRDYRLIGKDFIDFIRQTRSSDSTTLRDSISKSDGDWEDELSILESKEFSEVALLMSTDQARASFSSAMHRPSIVSRLSTEEQDPAVHRHSVSNKAAFTVKQVDDPEAATETTPLKASSGTKEADLSIKAIFSKETTRMYLTSYWANTFTNVAQSETFPLFAMAIVGGLGMEESSIGFVGSGAGLIYCVAQYFIFSAAMKHFGLMKSLRYGSFAANVPVFLMPISLLLTGTFQYAYLSLVMGALMIGNSVFYGCVTIGTNRSVDARQRATLNGLASAGASVGRALGPIFAGYLVAGSMTLGRVGGWIVYFVLAIAGSGAFATTLLVPVED